VQLDESEDGSCKNLMFVYRHCLNFKVMNIGGEESRLWTLPYILLASPTTKPYSSQCRRASGFLEVGLLEVGHE
jgi:hypothetical protein